MAIETCFNCEKKIGKLEQAFIYDGHIVCEQCYKKLQPKSNVTLKNISSQEKKGTDYGKIFAESIIFIGIIIALFADYFEWAILLACVFACFIRPLRKAGGLVMIIGGVFACLSVAFFPIGLISIFVGGVFMFI